MGKIEKEFGKYLRALREKRGLTLKQVERISKVSDSLIFNIESGKRGVPNFKALTGLAQTYGVSVAELITIAEQAAGGGKTMPESDVQFVARGLEKLSDEERKEFIGWIRYKISQKNDILD